MSTFYINTDEKFFNKIDVVMSRIQMLFVYFQNPDTEMSHSEYSRWIDNCNESQKELSDLLNECDTRILE